MAQPVPVPARLADPNAGGPPFLAEAGLGRRTLYAVPFWGPQAQLGLGGRVGRSQTTRLYGVFTFFNGWDDRGLRFSYAAIGLYLQQHVTKRLFVGASVDVGGAGLDTNGSDSQASGIGVGGHVGFDALSVGSTGALFLQVSPTAHSFSGHLAKGPSSYGVSLGLGVRL